VVGRVGDYLGGNFINSFQQIDYRGGFEAQLEEVAAALELRPVVPNQFRTLIAEKTDGFVGRDFVFAAIDKFFAEHASGYFIIEGDPGVGKSSLQNDFPAAAHAVSSSSGSTRGLWPRDSSSIRLLPLHVRSTCRAPGQ
jgi:hypothetical protein